MNEVKEIRYKNSVKIINNKYVLKLKTNNIDGVYDYLNNRGFNNYVGTIDNSSSYFIYPYIEDKIISKEDKANDIMKITALLHNKTTTYQDIDLDKIKEIYEDISNRINHLDDYYHSLHDSIEEKEFFSPADYLLIRNISKIYASIYYCKDTLEEWYKQIKKTTRQRYVLIHNNLRIDHLIENNEPYLISWEKSKRDLVIYDFVKFYKNEYQTLEMSSLFDMYQNKYRYTYDEYLLFTVLISIPPKMEFTSDNYINTIKVRNLIIYVKETDKFLSKENKKYKKTE